MRLGILGGTFNPIHLGHLRCAEEIGEQFDLEQIIFIPSAHPPHKKPSEVVSASERLKLTKLAISDNPRFLVSDVEIQRRGKSYSITTINYFRKKYGGGLNLFFILGMDAFQEITTWKDYPKLLACCNFIVTTRPRFKKKALEEILPLSVAKLFSYDRKNRCYVHCSNSLIYFREITLLNISSTMIRNNIRENRSIRYLLPERVEEYIRKRWLYC